MKHRFKTLNMIKNSCRKQKDRYKTIHEMEKSILDKQGKKDKDYLTLMDNIKSELEHPTPSENMINQTGRGLKKPKYTLFKRKNSYNNYSLKTLLSKGS